MINNLRAFQEVLKRNNLPTPDTYLGISELIRSLYRPDVSPNPERIREVLEELTWPVTVPAGNPITFKSCSGVLTSEALVIFTPKQSGTGDPSPENIRPISGWNSLNLTRTGKNLCNSIADNSLSYTAYTNYTLANGKVTVNGNTLMGFLVSVKPSTIYTYSIKNSNQVSMRVREYSGKPTEWQDDSFIVQSVNETKTSGNNSVTFTTTANTKYILCVIYCTIADTTIEDFQVELGSTATVYEPYQGKTNTATFPSTIMGGSYDFASGEGSKTWEYIAKYNGETLPGEWMSDRDVYAEGTTPTTGAEVAYITNTPTSITLTPADVNLLKGSNTVWTDGDNVTVKFQTLK